MWGRVRWWAALATYLDTTILFVAFPDVTATFGDSSASTLSWVLNAYTTAFAALLVRIGVGGATTQAVRQFGGSLGVALTIALLGSVGATGDLVAGFDRIWWLVFAGGIVTTLFGIPLRTAAAEAPPAARPDPRPQRQP